VPDLARRSRDLGLQRGRRPSGRAPAEPPCRLRVTPSLRTEVATPGASWSKPEWTLGDSIGVWSATSSSKSFEQSAPLRQE
jgi:hypothetical protein